jgi:hypothetical protein
VNGQLVNRRIQLNGPMNQSRIRPMNRRIANHQSPDGHPPGCYSALMVPAHRIIPSILAQVIRPAPLCQEKVAFAWQVSVGPAVSRATEVRLDDQGVLLVTAQNAQWRREVDRSLGLIRSRLDTLLGPNVIIRIETRGE